MNALLSHSAASTLCLLTHDNVHMAIPMRYSSSSDDITTLKVYTKNGYQWYPTWTKSIMSIYSSICYLEHVVFVVASYFGSTVQQEEGSTNGKKQSSYNCSPCYSEDIAGSRATTDVQVHTQTNIKTVITFLSCFTCTSVSTIWQQNIWLCTSLHLYIDTCSGRVRCIYSCGCVIIDTWVSFMHIHTRTFVLDK